MISSTQKNVSHSEKKNIFLKEHNCDYINKTEIKLRKKRNIGAINIAPEIGVLQTDLTVSYGKFFSLYKYVNNFKKIVINGKKWKKWLYANK